jgi:hypothetical protein
MITFNYVKNDLQNKLSINYQNTEQIVVYYTLTKLLGVSIKTALHICLFL